MRISRVGTFLVPPRWLFVRIETEAGVIGWGEASIEGHSNAVPTVVNQFAEHLVGSDPARIKDHRQVLTKSGTHRGRAVLGSAVSGIEHALWDIKGKALGVPVHKLLGGAVTAEYLAAGAVAVGIGDPLVGDAARGEDLRARRARAAEFLTVTEASRPSR